MVNANSDENGNTVYDGSERAGLTFSRRIASVESCLIRQSCRRRVMTYKSLISYAWFFFVKVSLQQRKKWNNLTRAVFYKRNDLNVNVLTYTMVRANIGGRQNFAKELSNIFFFFWQRSQQWIASPDLIHTHHLPNTVDQHRNVSKGKCRKPTGLYRDTWCLHPPIISHVLYLSASCVKHTNVSALMTSLCNLIQLSTTLSILMFPYSVNLSSVV